MRILRSRPRSRYGSRETKHFTPVPHPDFAVGGEQVRRLPKSPASCSRSLIMQILQFSSWVLICIRIDQMQPGQEDLPEFTGRQRAGWVIVRKLTGNSDTILTDYEVVSITYTIQVLASSVHNIITVLNQFTAHVRIVLDIVDKISSEILIGKLELSPWISILIDIHFLRTDHYVPHIELQW
ncbi:hypothetical protein FGO68_gene7743 [Halteria grandinella]|uniref:Uncharacterized protein n=1 Tax=Halteria grandinella TaxID=5974 RepID=A0A8J8SUY4_HALGN|nr:hypothetical protein FGO68_gene7743 [Halteria grandinella]